LFEPFDIIERMLAKLVVRGFAIQAILPAGVVKDGRSYFGAVSGVDEEGPNGICSIIHTEYKVLFLHMAVCRMQIISVKITFIFLVVKKYFESIIVGGSILNL
jgi:hypothetical protein